MNKVTCYECNLEASYNGTKGLIDWFIDEKEFIESRKIKKDLHLCEECRRSIGFKTMFKGPIKCGRCFKFGELGKGKWNTNQGHVECYELNNILCYDCHDLLHYNK